jgi:osmotically-inducible protein OsmY
VRCNLVTGLMVSGALTLSGCLSPQQDIDDRLASHITAALLASDELNLSRIEVNADGSTVYLSGMSDDHQSKVHAEKEALAFEGVNHVINKIEVDF